MANKRITDVDFVGSLNNNESFFINQNNAIRQINKSDMVFDIVNGGTNATTVEEARNNLEVYSKSEVDAVVEEAMRSGTITIPVNAWVQSATYNNLFYANMSGSVPYVNTDEKVDVFVSPAELPIENYDAYIENKVRAVEQGVETLGFVAKTKPEINILVNYTVFV